MTNECEFIINTVKQSPLYGDLDFINDESCCYINGNLGIPALKIRQIYSQGLRLMKTNSDYTICSLIVNPECYTAWNIRKKLLLEGKLDYKKECEFTLFLLSKHCSKPMIWAHRY
jgi:hypothetical protein